MPLLLIPVLLALVPLVEIAVFIYVGQAIGVWKVVALVLLSAVAGVMLLRYQSLGVLKKINREIRQGKTPEAGIFHGFLIAAGAILLIVPGFVTDTVGLLLMVPPVRRVIWHFVRSRITVTTFGSRSGRGFHRGQDDVVDLSPEDFARERPPRTGPSEIEHRD